MKSVQTIFHLLNVHFTTHGQILPRKKAKNPMAMGITKFNIGFRTIGTGEWCRTMDDSVFFFKNCHVVNGGNHSKDNLAKFGD
jgi:hypothetical protein